MTTATFVDLLDQPLVHRLSWTLIHSLWQLIATALLAAGMLAALRRNSANTRYLAACAMLLVMLAMPIATFISLAPRTESTTHATRVEAGLLSSLTAEPAPIHLTAAPLTPPLPHSPTATHIRLLTYLVPLYFSGILSLSLLHLGGWLQVQRLRRTHVKPIDASCRAQLAHLAIQLRVNRHVQLLESTLIQVPAVVGLFQPVILLPTSVLTGLTPQQIKSILAHELAHVRRHDYLVNLIQTAIETLLFYHPAVWWLSDRIRQERENCCDDLAAAACADRVEYAGALAAMEELRGVGAPHLALAARGGSLLRRIRRLLDVPDPAPRRGPSLLAAGAAVACIVLAAFSLNAHAKHADDAPTGEKAAATAVDGAEARGATAIKPEDLKVANEDYTINPGDLISVSIMELAGPGKETARTLRIPASGVIRLPHLSETDANGLTEHELEQLIRKKYNVEGIIQNPTVSVAVVEARARSFSILGQINKPGQCPLHDPDFRLLNAIAQAEGTKDGAVVARVLRKPKPVPGEEQPRGRTFDVPLKSLLEGNEDLNVVIRPGDTIVVTAPNPHLVRLVVGQDALAFEGQRTTWDELPQLLQKIPQAQRGATMLEIAVESNDITVGRFFEAQARASQLVKELGLSAVSFVGVHPLDSKGGQAPPAAGAGGGDVYISGTVQRPGAYSLGTGKITAKQLIDDRSAG